MAKNEGIGRLTAEDLEALGARKQETLTDYVKRWIEDNEAKVAALEARQQQNSVLLQVSIIAAGRGLLSGVTPRETASRAFDVYEALQLEYQSRKP